MLYLLCFLGFFKAKTYSFLGKDLFRFENILKHPTKDNPFLTKEYYSDIKDYQYFRNNFLEPPYERVSKLIRDPHKVRPQINTFQSEGEFQKNLLEKTSDYNYLKSIAVDEIPDYYLNIAKEPKYSRYEYRYVPLILFISYSMKNMNISGEAI